MRNSVLTFVAAIALAPVAAFAVPISGSMSMFGDLNPTGAGPGNDLKDATGLDFIGDDFFVDNVYGDLAAGGIAKGDVGFISDFQFNPLSPSPVNPLWSISGFQFVLTSITVVSQDSDRLSLMGNGYMTGAGFQDTGASWDLIVNAKIGQFFFGATTATVPEPATLLLFGASLLVFGFARRRKHTTTS